MESPRLRGPSGVPESVRAVLDNCSVTEGAFDSVARRTIYFLTLGSQLVILKIAASPRPDLQELGFGLGKV